MAHMNLQAGEQLRKSSEVGVKMIDFNDKKEITEYFLGNKHESEQIDIQKRTETLLSKNDLKSRTKVQDNSVISAN